MNDGSRTGRGVKFKHKKRHVSNGRRIEKRQAYAWKKTPWPTGLWCAERDKSDWKKEGLAR